LKKQFVKGRNNSTDSIQFSGELLLKMKGVCVSMKSGNFNTNLLTIGFICSKFHINKHFFI